MFDFTRTLSKFEYYWVGITDVEGKWKYTNGKPADDITLTWCNTVNWGGDCVYYHPCGMRYENCNAKFHALCQIHNGNC